METKQFSTILMNEPYVAQICSRLNDLHTWYPKVLVKDLIQGKSNLELIMWCELVLNVDTKHLKVHLNNIKNSFKEEFINDSVKIMYG